MRGTHRATEGRGGYPSWISENICVSVFDSNDHWQLVDRYDGRHNPEAVA
jgi:hypothetical protein